MPARPAWAPAPPQRTRRLPARHSRALRRLRSRVRDASAARAPRERQQRRIDESPPLRRLLPCRRRRRGAAAASRSCISTPPCTGGGRCSAASRGAVGAVGAVRKHRQHSSGALHLYPPASQAAAAGAALRRARAEGRKRNWAKHSLIQEKQRRHTTALSRLCLLWRRETSQTSRRERGPALWRALRAGFRRAVGLATHAHAWQQRKVARGHLVAHPLTMRPR